MNKTMLALALTAAFSTPLMAAVEIEHEMDVLVMVQPSLLQAQGKQAIYEYVTAETEMLNAILAKNNLPIAYKVVGIVENPMHEAMVDAGYSNDFHPYSRVVNALVEYYHYSVKNEAFWTTYMRDVVFMTSYVENTIMPELVDSSYSVLFGLLDSYGPDAVVQVVDYNDGTNGGGSAGPLSALVVNWGHPGAGAHELGHLLSLGDQYSVCDGTRLMCGYTSGHGDAETSNLSTEEVEKITALIADGGANIGGVMMPWGSDMGTRPAKTGFVAINVPVETVTEKGGSVLATVSLVDDAGLPLALATDVSMDLYVAADDNTVTTATESLTFLAGETEKTVALTIVDDALDNGDRVVTVGTRFGVGVNADSMAVFAVTDDDESTGGGDGGGTGGGTGGGGSGDSGGGGSTPVGGVLAGLVLLAARRLYQRPAR